MTGLIACRITRGTPVRVLRDEHVTVPLSVN